MRQTLFFNYKMSKPIKAKTNLNSTKNVLNIKSRLILLKKRIVLVFEVYLHTFVTEFCGINT